MLLDFRVSSSSLPSERGQFKGLFITLFHTPKTLIGPVCKAEAKAPPMGYCYLQAMAELVLFVAEEDKQCHDQEEDDCSNNTDGNRDANCNSQRVARTSICKQTNEEGVKQYTIRLILLSLKVHWGKLSYNVRPI